MIWFLWLIFNLLCFFFNVDPFVPYMRRDSVMIICLNVLYIWEPLINALHLGNTLSMASSCLQELFRNGRSTEYKLSLLINFFTKRFGIIILATSWIWSEFSQYLQQMVAQLLILQKFIKLINDNGFGIDIKWTIFRLWFQYMAHNDWSRE